MISFYHPDGTATRLPSNLYLCEVNCSSNGPMLTDAVGLRAKRYQRLRPPPIDQRKRRRAVFGRAILPRCTRHRLPVPGGCG